LGQEAGLQVQWAVEVDLRSAGVGDLGRLATQEEAAVSDIRAVPGLSHATVSGRLRSLIPQVQPLVSEGVAPIYLVVLIIAALGLAVLVGIGALTLSRRSFELSVFKSRGARTLHLLLAQTIEGVLAAILGSAVAVVVGLLLALLARDAHGPGLPGVSFPIALSRSAVLVGAGGAVVAVAFLVLVSVPYVRRTVVEERRLASREERPVWG